MIRVHIVAKKHALQHIMSWLLAVSVMLQLAPTPSVACALDGYIQAQAEQQLDPVVQDATVGTVDATGERAEQDDTSVKSLQPRIDCLDRIYLESAWQATEDTNHSNANAEDAYSEQKESTGLDAASEAVEEVLGEPGAMAPDAGGELENDEAPGETEALEFLGTEGSDPHIDGAELHDDNTVHAAPTAAQHSDPIVSEAESERTQKASGTQKQEDRSAYATRLIAECDGYRATVVLDEGARVPLKTQLLIRVLSVDDIDAQLAIDAINAEAEQDERPFGEGSPDYVALDLSLVDPNGNEVEPAGPVQVKLEMTKLPAGEDSELLAQTMEVRHIDESGKRLSVETVVSCGGAYVEDSQVVTEFVTGSFSTFVVTWNSGRSSATIHYGYLEGGTFHEIADPVPVSSLAPTDSRQCIVYDFEGYHYAGGTYYHTSATTNPTQGGSQIAQLLLYANNAWYALDMEGKTIAEIKDDYGWYSSYYISNYTSFANRFISLANNSHVYVTYEPEGAVTQGGVPKVYEATEADPASPTILKELTHNDDGTAELSLSITGQTATPEFVKLADVIVVFDISTSMDTQDMGGNATRLSASKAALKALVDQLAQKKNRNGDPLVRMSLISFGSFTQEVMPLTDLDDNGVAAYKAAVNGITLEGATNWERALRTANEQSVDPDRATYVIFMTDGDPTCRDSRYVGAQEGGWEPYTRHSGVAEIFFGTGQFTSYQGYAGVNVLVTRPDFLAGVEQGKAIVAANKRLYTIGISEDVRLARSFNNQAGGQGCYEATTTTQLKNAFANIGSQVGAEAGWADVNLVDGITAMTQTPEKSGLGGTGGELSYWIKRAGATDFVAWDPEAAGCGLATYDEDSGAVVWSMGEDFVLQKDVTYKVSWKVWPNQEAYDLCIKCQNDPGLYDTLSDAQKAQIVRTQEGGAYTYGLKTNEPGAHASFRSASKTSSSAAVMLSQEVHELLFNEVDPLLPTAIPVTLRKTWRYGSKQIAQTGSYDFAVLADGEQFGTAKLTSASSPAWETPFALSLGVMTDIEGELFVYTEGHEFTLSEPEDLADRWTMSTDVYRAMLVNGEPVLLKRTESEDEADYVIGGQAYQRCGDTFVLEAVNTLDPDKATVSATVKKVWDDDGDTHGVRPQSLEVTLMARGANVLVVTLNSENGWEATVDGLLRYDEGGTEVSYSWSEEEVAHYTQSAAVTEGSVTTLTNTYVPDEPPDDPKPPVDDEDDPVPPDDGKDDPVPPEEGEDNPVPPEEGKDDPTPPEDGNDEQHKNPAPRKGRTIKIQKVKPSLRRILPAAGQQAEPIAAIALAGCALLLVGWLLSRRSTAKSRG